MWQRIFNNPSQVYADWFIADDDLIVGYRNGSERLLRRTKKGIPQGARGYGSEAEARRELDFMRRQGFFPLFTKGARPVRLTWR